MHAILAVVTVLTPILELRAVDLEPASSPEGWHPPETRDDSEPPAGPVRVSFRLADGVRVTGELTAWDAEGFDGSFGRRRWVDLKLEDVWKLMRRLMDRESATAWVTLGGVLLRMDDGEAMAERAFAQASQLDRSVAPLIEEARASAAAVRLEEERRRQAIAAERLSIQNPEAQDWPSDPWPVLTADERRAAIAEVRAQSEQIVRDASMSLVPVESDFFLVYSDLPRRETATWARQLDLTCGWLARLLQLEEGDNLFWGKAVAFIFTDREQYRLIEAQAFGQLAIRSVDGVCHYRGPQVFLNVYRDQDDGVFAATLVRQAVHGIMHRYQSPRRLPTWANEGLAYHVTVDMRERSIVDQQLRPRALSFVRGGGPVDAVLSMTYESWPGPDSVGPAVGMLMIELMSTQQPVRFARWIRAVKQGTEWEQALREQFGVTRGELVGTFSRYYTVND